MNVPALYDKRLTYRGEAAVGSLVRVPLGNRLAAGIVVANAVTPEILAEDVRAIESPMYGGHPWLNEDLLDLARAVSEFYLCSFGAALELMLPVPFSQKEISGLKRPRGVDQVSVSSALTRARPEVLTSEQQAAVDDLTQAMSLGHTTPILLFGVTGSGKTEVYLRAIERALELGKQAMYLVPEISLTPQVVSTLIDRFGGNVGVLHSALSPGEKARTWRRIQAGEVRLVVGARSAVFAPTQDLGLVILDEEHETSYRHEGGVNFHTRIVAQMRVKKHRGLLVLGSATPSLDVFYSALRGRTKLLTMSSRPKGSTLPEVEIVDLREQLRQGHRGLVSVPLQGALHECLALGEQALLLFNRRGYAQFFLCQDCGHIPLCPHCDVSLHFHANASLLKCHYCGYTERVRQQCSKCGSSNIRNRGAGTEKLEEEIAMLFPGFLSTRIDADTTSRKGDHLRLLTEFGSANSHILLGTRMIAKGLDFPNVTVVGVIDADSGLFFPDFRAVEESFQLLMQVSGRSGRGKLKGKVFIQTYNPEHYCIRLAAQQDYRAFYEVENRLRRKLSYPPFGGLVTIHFRGTDQAKVRMSAESIVALVPRQEGFTVLGPVASSPEKVKDVYRYQVSIKGHSRKQLQALVANLKLQISASGNQLVNWFVVVD